MMHSSAASSVSNEIAGRRLPGFALVGVLGFIIDAAILSSLMIGLGMGPYSGRAISFATAVSVTWYANRRWVFRPDRCANRRREYTAYFSTQICGAVINLGIYGLVIAFFPGLAETPVIPLAFGAAVALAFNYSMSSLFVFASDPRDTRNHQPMHDVTKDEGSTAYNGRDNLEAMRHAQRYNRHLLTLIQHHASGSTVLDFGAGTGTFAVPMARRHDQFICLEPDETLSAALIELGLTTATDLSEITDQSVDYIYSLNVLEHIENDIVVLKNLNQKLKHGGRLFLYVPAFELLYSAMDRKVGHYRRYRRSNLVSRLEENGFHIITSRYADSLGFIATLLYKMFGDDSGVVSPGAVAAYDRFAFPLSQLIDRLTSRFFGKNVMVLAEKSSTSQKGSP
jgi:putative flippase GtrA/ubiquinone/menaquinone biosynthesis C-methylase UbiE